MKKFFQRSKLRYFIALLIVDAMFFGLTDPAEVPSFALIIGFLLFTITLYQLIKGLFVLGSWYGLRFNKQQKRFARIVTGVIAGLIALQSMGQLGQRDILVLIPLALVAYLYMSYGRSASEPVTASE